MDVELIKNPYEAGKYLNPELYGMPETAAVHYREERELQPSGGPTERKPLEAFDPNDGE
jgi:hypothetical protein